MAGWRKTAEEFGPLLVFFILNARGAQWFEACPKAKACLSPRAALW